MSGYSRFEAHQRLLGLTDTANAVRYNFDKYGGTRSLHRGLSQTERDMGGDAALRDSQKDDYRYMVESEADTYRHLEAMARRHDYNISRNAPYTAAEKLRDELAIADAKNSLGLSSSGHISGYDIIADNLRIQQYQDMYDYTPDLMHDRLAEVRALETFLVQSETSYNNNYFRRHFDNPDMSDPHAFTARCEAVIERAFELNPQLTDAFIQKSPHSDYAMEYAMSDRGSYIQKTPQIPVKLNTSLQVPTPHVARVAPSHTTPAPAPAASVVAEPTVETSPPRPMGDATMLVSMQQRVGLLRDLVEESAKNTPEDLRQSAYYEEIPYSHDNHRTYFLPSDIGRTQRALDAHDQQKSNMPNQKLHEGHLRSAENDLVRITNGDMPADEASRAIARVDGYISKLDPSYQPPEFKPSLKSPDNGRLPLQSSTPDYNTEANVESSTPPTITPHGKEFTTYAFDSSTQYHIPGQTFEMTGGGARSVSTKWDGTVKDVKTNSIENVKCDVSRASFDPKAKAYDEVTLEFEGHKHGECESSPIYQRMIGENLGASNASMAYEMELPFNKGEEVFRLDTDTSAFRMQTIVKNPDDGAYYSISCHDIDKIRDLQDKGELGNTIEKALNTNPRYAVKLTGENLPEFLGSTRAEPEPKSPSDKLTSLFNQQQPDTFNAESNINQMRSMSPTQDVKLDQAYNPVV